MQNKFCVIKNGLVLTLDSEGYAGYFNIIIKGNKIFDIDYQSELSSDEIIRKKYPDAEIFDASDKLIMPSFLNAQKNSSYFISRYFLKRNLYDNLKANIPIRLLEKYFSDTKNQDDLLKLFALSYINSFADGETFLNESSEFISGELIKSDFFSRIRNKPDMIMTVYDEYLSDYYLGLNRFHCIGLREEDDMNNYSLNSLKKTLSRGNKRALIEVLRTANSLDIIRNLFGKSFIKVLLDNELLSQYIILSNPVYLALDEISVLEDKKVNILFCPTDVYRLSRKSIDYELFLNRNFNISLGTGITGTSIFREMKLLYNTTKAIYQSSEDFLKMITVNPSEVFGISNIYGTIEKNKIANLIFFDLSDIRNFLNIPEVNSEKISEFVIENLDEKDISDVMFRGEMIIRNYENIVSDNDEIKSQYWYLAGKIFEVGKYYEFKEKSRMRERVREMSLGLDSKTKQVNYIPPPFSEENVFSDTNNSEDSDFRIIGVRKPDYVNDTSEWNDIAIEEQNLLKDLSDNITEIKNFDSGFELDYLYSDYEMKIQSQAADGTMSDETMKHSTKAPTKKIFFDDSTGEVKIESLTGDKKEEVKSQDKAPKVSESSKEKMKAIFKKGKMRFGFDDEVSGDD